MSKKNHNVVDEIIEIVETPEIIEETESGLEENEVATPVVEEVEIIEEKDKAVTPEVPSKGKIIRFVGKQYVMVEYMYEEKKMQSLIYVGDVRKYKIGEYIAL